MLDFRILEQFVAFYHTGTLCEAATELHISQSTLTRSMQQLEAEFDVPLFSRTKNRITLTTAGEMAASDAEMVLRQYENMLQRVRDFDRRNRAITIGACAPVPLTDTMQRLTHFYPNSMLSSELKKIPDLLTGLLENTYQLIILPYCPDDSTLISTALCSEHLFFYLHKKHRYAKRKSLHVAEMDGENMLLFQDIGFWHDLVQKKMPNSRFLLQSERYSFVELIQNSIMPAFSTDAAQFTLSDDTRVNVAIADPEFHVTYYLVCQKKNKAKFHALFST